MNRIIRHVTVTQIRLSSTRPPINPKGRFDDRNEADLEAVKKLPQSQKGKLFMEEAPIPKWPGGVNPNTGEKGGPGIYLSQRKFKSLIMIYVNSNFALCLMVGSVSDSLLEA